MFLKAVAISAYGPELTSRHVRHVVAIEEEAEVTRSSAKYRP
jgi:hypothetical protein